MSRRIKIYSEQITEIDLATEVINELNIGSLSFNQEKKCFENIQYDDIEDDSISRAEKLYYNKRKTRNIEKINQVLESRGYKTSIKQVQDNTNKTTKIIAIQKIYE